MEAKVSVFLDDMILYIPEKSKKTNKKRLVNNDRIHYTKRLQH